MSSTKSPDVVILDYGLGNLFNVQRALESIGARPVISSDPLTIRKASKLILPGVGAFHDGMKGLETRGLTSVIQELAEEGKPILGICLGMQLLMSTSEENGFHKGLNIIKGKVIRLHSSEDDSDRLKIPQLGWNYLEPFNDASQKLTSWENTILQDLSPRPFVYFMHSYCVLPDDADTWLATTVYGKDRFCSVVKKDNIMGCQFHPERSGETGLKILKNFAFNGSGAHPALFKTSEMK